MKQFATWLGLIGLMLTLAACTSPKPTDPVQTVGPTTGSVEDFQTFSGLSVPAEARDIDVRVTLDTQGAPSYKVSFHLPSDKVDTFCQDGEMGRPLRVQKVPADVAKTFGDDVDASAGLAVARASLPSNVAIQRMVIATQTETATATVQVAASKMPR